MGSDRYFSDRFVAEANFWPARALLERTAKTLRGRPLSPDEEQLLKDIEILLLRTDRA